MKVEKDVKKVSIACVDGTFVRGKVHVDPGLRVSDLLNSQKFSFVVVTRVVFSNYKILPFNLHKEIFAKKKHMIAINKNAIKWIEEI